MLIRLRRTIALLLVLFAAVQLATGQKAVPLRKTPAPFQSFYKSFARTLNRGRIDLLADMTRFPFKYGFDAGDEGVWTRKEFVEKANGFLMPSPLVFKHKDPEFRVKNGVYTLTHGDDAAYYTFRKTSGGYKWVSYIVEP